MINCYIFKIIHTYSYYYCRYITPVEFGYQLPRTNVPEYAFIGRSNVGKSSLVNALLGNSKLVRVSKSPGCTQSVNYYALEKNKQSPTIYLVDLPGYGYAKASKTDREAWRTTITGYLHSRMQGTLRYT